MRIDRRTLLVAAGALVIATPGWAAGPVDLTVYKDPNCGCCRGWVTHMSRAGFRPRVVETTDLRGVRARLRVPSTLASCHTAVVAGYVVEGHVPPEDVRRLLRERPQAIGLAAPGMPVGAPGMERPDGAREPYRVMLFGPRGARVFVAHS